MNKSVAALIWVFVTGLLVVSVSGYVAPFSSNQNTYFLHGLAATGYGELSRDWLTAHAGTFPVFSRLITAMYWFGRPVGDSLAFGLYVLSCGAYAFALYAISLRIFPHLASARILLPFLAVLAVFHSYVLAAASLGLTAIPALGVAGFYPLGGIFQPQAFAVLLLVGMAMFLWGRVLWGACTVAVACVLHPAYLAAGGLIVFGMLIAEWRKGVAPVRILLTGVAALLIVTPMVLHIFTTFAGADPEAVKAAHKILAEFRGPHHVLLSHWLWHPWLGIDPAVLVKFGLCVAAIFLVRRTPLVWPLGACVAGMWLFTLYYAVTGNHSVGVAYPWRGFALLVPLSSALVVAWALTRERAGPSAKPIRETPPPLMPVRLPGRKDFQVMLSWMEPEPAANQSSAVRNIAAPEGRRSGVLSFRIEWASIILVAGLCAGGLFLSVMKHMHRFDSTGALHAFVASNLSPEDLYLVPSSDIIMMSFRLETGAPLYVDWKSHPVTPGGFLEWYDRIRLAAPAFTADHRVDCTRLEGVLEAVPEITHVVSSDKEAPCPEALPGLKSIYADAHYSVWRRTNEQDAAVAGSG